MDAAWWNHCRNAASIGQARVKDRLRLRNVVTQSSGNVFDSYDERFGCEFHSGYRLHVPRLFDEDPLRSVDHDFADVRVQNQVLDRTKKRENQLESIHQSCPSAS